MSHATKSWTKATKFANLALVLDLTGGDAIYTTPKGVYIASPFSFFFMLLFSFFRCRIYGFVLKNVCYTFGLRGIWRSCREKKEAGAAMIQKRLHNL